MAESDAQGVFNVGGVTCTLGEVAESIAKAKGVAVKYVTWPDLALRLESGATFFDSTKLDKAMNKTAYRDIRSLVQEI